MRAIKSGAQGPTHEAFRFHVGCCYLKFRKPISSLDHPSQRLVSGFYLPIEYYDLLVRSDTVKGARGGIIVSYQTVPRYVTNDMFVSLVRGGWVGSHGATTQGLTDIVLAGLSDGHSVTVAEASSVNDDGS